MIEKVVLYKQGKNIDPAIVFSAILDNNGKVRRNRMYRLYSGHGYNRGWAQKSKMAFLQPPSCVLDC